VTMPILMLVNAAALTPAMGVEAVNEWCPTGKRCHPAVWITSYVGLSPCCWV
jgi:hypothetical protein